jgi:pyridoxal phosphate enzyme (YggS family)
LDHAVVTTVKRPEGAEGAPDGSRRSEVAASLRALLARIDSACDRFGRDPGEVTLVAVTKTWPASDVGVLAGLGVTDVGENRVAELQDKRLSVTDPLTWHFLGRIQSRQAGAVARSADVVHSVDRLSVARRLAAAAAEAHRRLQVFVQLSFDGDPGRGGAAAADLPGLADAVHDLEGLDLVGVMAVPLLGSDPWASYAELARTSASLRDSHPQAGLISAGMSEDLEAAVAHGATHLRVGSALLGRRHASGDKVGPDRSG